MKLLKKPFAYASIFGMLLTSGFSYSMLKTFVLSEAITTVAASNATTSSQNTATSSSSTAATTATNVSTTDTSYTDDNI